MAASTVHFPEYLRRAYIKVLEDEQNEAEGGDLELIHKLCRRGVEKNWKKLDADSFLERYLWCVGSIRKKIKVHEKHFPGQKCLFRCCDAQRIAKEKRAIRSEWAKDKHDLNSKMLEAVLYTAQLVAAGWDSFKEDYLLRPTDPQTEHMKDWLEAYSALDSLPMVGEAIAWYLIRNLYGAPFFKPDLHINKIANHFFPDSNSSVEALSDAVRKYWPEICKDSRFLDPVHLGEVDYILWWYCSQTRDPS